MGKLFGTDGIRGKANVYPMTPWMVLRIGKAIAHYFSKKVNADRSNEGGRGRRARIVIGKDTRLSGYMIENALASGIVSMGVDVHLVGPLPTPAIAHLTKSMNCDGGIMLTASHNPAEDNGIKIFGSDGFKLGDDVEEEIEAYALSEEIKTDHIFGEDIGKAYRIDNATGRYIEFAKASVKSARLSGLKIVLDCANGAAYKVAPAIFRELGAEVIVINDKPDGLNINKECGATHTAGLRSRVVEERADIGLAFDGDADRIIIVDEKGEEVGGDFVLVLLALFFKKKEKLKGDSLVVTQYSNLCVEEVLGNEGIKVVRVKNGDRYVIEAMRKEGYLLGGEASGHIIVGDYCTTGDGIISALYFLSMVKEDGRSVSAICNIMKPYPQLVRSIVVREKKPFDEMKGVVGKIKEIEDKMGGDGRVLVRYSGTQQMCRVMVEGKVKEEVEQYVKEIVMEIEKEVGM